MRKILFIVAVTLSATMFAQKQIDEGVIISKQTMSSDNEQMNAQLAMLGDMTTTTYFKNDKSRSELSNPMTGNTVFIADNNSKKSLVLMDNPMIGKKYMESDISPSEEDAKGISIEKTNETKTILGYECTKYNVTMNRDGADVQMEVYATDKLKAISQQATTFGKEFSGFPMYMSMAINQQGMKMNMVIEVTDVKAEKVADEKFNMTPPEGYSKTENLPGM
ncbi:DUF4412 domain-containing protein [Gelidibacter maritimus]|uniref:DUF4412 domain-containing protein n=1 Tax=Gelidibacter maritimus TaxID=2761487 RepID=A0A7W2M6V2_9FLAO|nr:DUF4412 domain-containing protein [Gelidibacter maritimus]MBA6153784.1 hypothetical protein [Gelidibacter maritimus]